MATLGVYSYVIRGMDYDRPFMEMIKSVLSVADEVVVVTDPRFEEGTLRRLQSIDDRRIKIHDVEIDFDNPNWHGATKALARSKCDSDILMEMDPDEVVRPEDVKKIDVLKNDWPKGAYLVAAGLINWFNGEHFKLSGAWCKERFSLNDPRITHGIRREFRVERGDYTGAKKGTTTGAGYVSKDEGFSLEASVLLSTPARVPTDIVSPDAVYIHNYRWYSLPRAWEMKQTTHYLQGVLDGRYESLDDYKVDLDGEHVDFWGPPIKKAPRSYIKPICDEMRGKSIIKAKGVHHPSFMRDWIARQRVYVPACWWKRQKEVNRNMGPRILR